MRAKSLSVLLVVAALLKTGCPAFADTLANPSTEVTQGSTPAEATANTSAFPKQILRTGINLNTTGVSANSVQLANNIHLTPILERIQTLRQRIDTLASSPERSDARMDLLESKAQALQIIGRTNLEIDFAIAEMTAEQNVYNEILSTFTGDRDKLLARVNAASFISNGILWAACEGMSIPSFNTNYAKNPRHVCQWPIPSGIVGIAAGIVPSLASMYTLKAVNGKQKTSEVEPNMLAKLFNYPTNADIEYPDSVWSYLNEVPAGDAKGKTRKDQMVDRWISDSNIPGFTNRNSKSQLDVITASVAQKKGLSIATLSTRQVMLQQLSAEILKMKRMLLELAMVVQGDKQFVAMELRPTPTSKLPNAAPRAIASKDALLTTDAAAYLTSQAMEGLGVP